MVPLGAKWQCASKPRDQERVVVLLRAPLPPAAHPDRPTRSRSGRTKPHPDRDKGCRHGVAHAHRGCFEKARWLARDQDTGEPSRAWGRRRAARGLRSSAPALMRTFQRDSLSPEPTFAHCLRPAFTTRAAITGAPIVNIGMPTMRSATPSETLKSERPQTSAHGASQPTAPRC